MIWHCLQEKYFLNFQVVLSVQGAWKNNKVLTMMITMGMIIMIMRMMTMILMTTSIIVAIMLIMKTDIITIMIILRMSKTSVKRGNVISWWRHQMETFSPLLAICAGNSPVPGEFPTQRPVTRSFDVFFDLRLNKRLSKQPWDWCFETLSCPLWRHRNVMVNFHTQWRISHSSVTVQKTETGLWLISLISGSNEHLGWHGFQRNLVTGKRLVFLSRKVTLLNTNLRKLNLLKGNC